MMMRLEKFAVDSGRFLDAERELLEQEGVVVEKGYPVVYTRGMEGYPHCKILVEKLEKLVGLRFAFIKVQRAAPKKALGGFHVDVHWSSGIKREGKGEVLRFLLNAHTAPRVVAYIREGKEWLRKKGVLISDTEYGIISLPDDVTPQRIEIPPIEKNAIWGLKFWASKVPHVGITDENGLFVIGFGKYV